MGMISYTLTITFLSVGLMLLGKAIYDLRMKIYKLETRIYMLEKAITRGLCGDKTRN